MNLNTEDSLQNFKWKRYTVDEKLGYVGNKEVSAANLAIASKAFTVLLSVRANGDKDQALIVSKNHFFKGLE